MDADPSGNSRSSAHRLLTFCAVKLQRAIDDARANSANFAKHVPNIKACRLHIGYPGKVVFSAGSLNWTHTTVADFRHKGTRVLVASKGTWFADRISWKKLSSADLRDMDTTRSRRTCVSHHRWI